MVPDLGNEDHCHHHSGNQSLIADCGIEDLGIFFLSGLFWRIPQCPTDHWPSVRINSQQNIYICINLFVYIYIYIYACFYPLHIDILLRGLPWLKHPRCRFNTLYRASGDKDRQRPLVPWLTNELWMITFAEYPTLSLNRIFIHPGHEK